MYCPENKEIWQVAHENSDTVQAEIWLKGQQEVGEVMGDLGLAFFKLAKFETENTMVPCQRMFAADVKRAATAAVKASRFYRESNAFSVKNLVGTSSLSCPMRFILSHKHIFIPTLSAF